MARWHYASRSSEPFGFTLSADRAFELESTTTIERDRADTFGRTNRVANSDRLLEPDTLGRCSPSGAVRSSRNAVHRLWQRGIDAPLALSRPPSGASDTGLDEFLGTRLSRRKERTEGPLPEALLARRPAERGAYSARKASQVGASSTDSAAIPKR